MTNMKMASLVADLLNNTRGGSLEWKRGGSRNSFQLVYPLYSVIVALEKYEDYEEGMLYFYSITLVDEDGEVVDEAGKSDLPDQAYNMLIELFTEARKVAKKADDAYAYFTTELKSKKSSD